MKKVFTNSMTAHVWAQQTQEEGRNSNKSIFFEGPTIYSYGKHFFIGHFSKPNIVLLNSQYYSVTTSQHQGEVSRAIPSGVKIFRVPTIDNHAENIKSYKEQIDKFANTAKNAPRTYYQTSLENAQGWIDYTININRALLDYCQEFNAPYDLEWENICADFELIKARKKKNDDKYNSPKEVEKRRRAKELKEKRERAKQIYSIRKSVKAFRENSNPFLYIGEIPILLRLDGETIKTTKNAEMPVKFAKNIWQMVKHCRSEKVSFKPNGKTLHAGHFQVNEIDLNGNLTAGCHFIKYGVLKNMARQLNLLEASY